MKTAAFLTIFLIGMGLAEPEAETVERDGKSKTHAFKNVFQLVSLTEYFLQSFQSFKWFDFL